jgi:hypothetical protein
VSSLCRDQAPKARSAARPEANHKARKNLITSASSEFGQTSEAASIPSVATAHGSNRIHPTLFAAARVGFFAVSALPHPDPVKTGQIRQQHHHARGPEQDP